MKTKLPKQKEDSVHRQVAQYLRVQYPTKIFRTDGGGLRLPTGLANKFASLQMKRAYPDLFVAEPKKAEVISQKDSVVSNNFNVGFQTETWTTSGYSGLFLELKRPDTKLIRDKDAVRPTKGEKVLRKKGDWFDQHIQEQAEMLQELRKRGYKAEFAVGFSEAKKIIDEYLK